MKTEMKNIESKDVGRRARRVVDLFNLHRFDGLKAELFQPKGTTGRYHVYIHFPDRDKVYAAHEWGILASRMLLEGLHVSDGPGGIDYLGMKVW